MTMRARKAPDLGPAALGLGALACALAAQEVVIRLGFVSRFIVPLPSEIGPAFLRLIIEEDVLGRFLMTSGEALGAGLLLALVGITSGIVLYRVQLLRRAYETWIAAFASAPIVLMYPLFLVIFGRNAVTIITKILLPSALPTIFVGLRLGLLFALINIVGVEFLINFGGLGQLINDLAERYDLPGTYAAIGFVVLVSIVFFDVTERIERWLRPGS
jgi:ABC-type nitrate/sulfonate/bicarbonate transport system permease component